MNAPIHVMQQPRHRPCMGEGSGVAAEWLKLPPCKVGARGLLPRSGIHMIQVSNKRLYPPPHPLVRNSIVWSFRDGEVACLPSDRARISSPVSRGQCHLIHLTIPKRFPWASIACIHVRKGRLTLFPLRYLFKIFTHLKLCLAAAIHNFKWVEIPYICLIFVTKKIFMFKTHSLTITMITR